MQRTPQKRPFFENTTSHQGNIDIGGPGDVALVCGYFLSVDVVFADTGKVTQRDPPLCDAIIVLTVFVGL